jgi:hypothetical protein
MIHNPHQHVWLFRFASKVLKFFLLSLFGLGITCLLSVVLGILPLLEILINSLGWWLVRITVVIVCLMATAVLLESIR